MATGISISGAVFMQLQHIYSNFPLYVSAMYVCVCCMSDVAECVFKKIHLLLASYRFYALLLCNGDQYASCTIENGQIE